MVFDLASFPGWLVVALCIGVVVGWRTYSNEPRRGWFAGWVPWGLLAFAAGLLVAVLMLLPGRYGLWLEIALLMTACYILGCFLGGFLKRLLGAHEPVGAVARVVPDADDAATAGAERRSAATAKTAVERLAAEAAAKAEAERQAAAGL